MNEKFEKFKKSLKPYVKGLVKLGCVIILIIVGSTVSYNCGYDKGFDTGYDSGYEVCKTEETENSRIYIKALQRVASKALDLQAQVKELESYVRSLTPFDGARPEWEEE